MPTKKPRSVSSPSTQQMQSCVSMLLALRPKFVALWEQQEIDHGELESLTNRFKTTAIEMYGPNSQQSERYEDWHAFFLMSYNSSDPQHVFDQMVQKAYHDGIKRTITELDSLVDQLQLKLQLTGAIVTNVTKKTVNKIFIGHGGSPAWRDLKDLVKDRLGLPVEEFNSSPAAGLTTVERLTEMLESSSLAFLVMTGEDETAEGKIQARLNVVHEIGLFQGRLGFKRAIVLLEEGCEEFSNISGLTQIRFPKGNILAKSEELRKVLEREGLLPPPE